MVVKVATTIQITSEEDQELRKLKRALRLPSKKAVVLEGVRALRRLVQDEARRSRLQEVSRKVRGSSLEVNREWSPLSVAVKGRT